MNNLKCFFLILLILIFILNDYIKTNFTVNLYEYIMILISFLLSNQGGDYNSNFKFKIKNLLNDPNNLNVFNKIKKKYGPYINIYIPYLGKSKLILDIELTKKIFNINPETKILKAGLGKQIFGNNFMKDNVAGKIGKNWTDSREHNDLSFDTKYFSNLSENYIKIILNNTYFPKNISEFNELAYNLTNKFIYGDNENSLEMVKELRDNFILKNKNIYKCPFFNKWKKFNDDFKSKSNTILNKLKIYDNKEDLHYVDQIPHCIVPFGIMIKFLIPILVVILYNFDEFKNKILDEINDTNFNIYAKDTYLHFFVIENIRMFNPINIAGVDRYVLNDFELNNIKFKKGENIFTMFTNIRFDEKTYPEPNLFKPDRWKNKTIEEQNEVFGIGPQQCPSVNISPLIYKALIINFLKNDKYKLIKPIIKYHDIVKINPYDIKFSV